MQIYPLFILCFAHLFGTLSFARRYFRSKKQKKTRFLLFFTHLFVPLHPNFKVNGKDDTSVPG